MRTNRLGDTGVSVLAAGAIVGMRSAAEVHANLAAFNADIPAALWSDLRFEGLIDGRAPLPG
jgi:D-threo-aldose 1-dehydrogenase